MCLILSLVRLSEKTARRDLNAFKKKIRFDLNSFFRSSGITISRITVTSDGWLNAVVDNESVFMGLLDRSLQLPTVWREKETALVTGSIGKRATSEGIEVLLRDGDKTKKVFLKTDKLKTSLPLIEETESTEILNLLCLKPLFPIQLFLRREVRLSNYQAELFVDWVRCGLDAVHVWDLTESELKEAVPADILRRFIADIEFYGVLAFRLLVKLGVDPLEVEAHIRDFCESKWIQARTEVFHADEARKILSPASQMRK